MKLRLGSSVRYSQHVRDLLMAVSFDVVQDEHDAGLFGEAGDRMLKVETVLRRVLWSAGVVRVEIVRDLHAVVAALVCPECEHDVIDSQPMKPCGKRRFTPERTEGFPRFDDHVLRQFFRELSVPHEPQAQRVHAADVSPIHSLEGRMVAALGQRDVTEGRVVVCSWIGDVQGGDVGRGGKVGIWQRK